MIQNVSPKSTHSAWQTKWSKQPAILHGECDIQLPLRTGEGRIV